MRYEIYNSGRWCGRSLKAEKVEEFDIGVVWMADWESDSKALGVHILG